MGRSNWWNRTAVTLAVFGSSLLMVTSAQAQDPLLGGERENLPVELIPEPAEQAPAQAPDGEEEERPEAPSFSQLADNDSIGIGLGAGLALVYLPEDQDFSAASVPVDLFLDWDSPIDIFKLRLGYNTAVKNEVVISSALSGTVTTTALYGAFRYTLRIGSRNRLNLLAGGAIINSILENSVGTFSEGDSGLGLMVGGGYQRDLQTGNLGVQIVVFSRQGDFDGVSVFTGSNQIQLTGGIDF